MIRFWPFTESVYFYHCCHMNVLLVIHCVLCGKGCEFTVRVSFLEIYNEELTDLLGADSVENPRLKIYEDNLRKVVLLY